MMRITRRRRAIALFITLGVVMVGVTLTLQAGWVILNWRRLVPLFVGIPFFALLIAGLILNTIFLVREVRRNERHDSFLNAVTHELKTPIASIRLYLETLQRRATSEQQRQEFYRIMLLDSDRLLASVEQVLKAGEVGQRPKNKNRISVDMETVTAECVETTRRRYHLEPGALTLEVAPHRLPMAVRGDPADLQMAILNVLDNAIKYSPNGVKVSVKLGLDEDAWVVLRVTDAGLGIPPAHLKRIFKRFYRVPGRSSFQMKGTGLGLFLVRSIARQHGGDASAESPGEGKGTTITLQLPRVLSARSEAASTEAANPQVASSPAALSDSETARAEINAGEADVSGPDLPAPVSASSERSILRRKT